MFLGVLLQKTLLATVCSLHSESHEEVFILSENGCSESKSEISVNQCEWVVDLLKAITDYSYAQATMLLI